MNDCPLKGNQMHVNISNKNENADKYIEEHIFTNLETVS